jgi:ABC-type branched-subunit amino acid transport system ATPase component
VTAQTTLLEEVPLVAEDVRVSFGGVHALRGVSLRVQPGEIVGLIGGNGAGKTTFMDCVSGYVEASGTVRAFGQDITGMAPELRPYVGIVRSFQDARLYPGLSVTESLLVAAERRKPTPLFGSLLGLGVRAIEAEKRALVDEVVETLGLAPYQEKMVRELSTGTRRVVDIATVVVQEPRLVLLDEPTSGLAQRETEAFGPLVRWLRERLDCSVLLIEHDMPLITSVADRLYAFETGAVIAEGPPAAVIADERVIASYLGVDETAIRRSGTVSRRRRRVLTAR